ncbi:Asp-tRNA(Asn)/Glu-tRNA(Gln) amidotransferase subunit GatB [candidate division WWE3 bacterium]|uniref:Aspartyl/glutamyl-tRNA(Asn/Gln) amidotransferase subunit B n=1 Tax=candidate division WWE3 bacterium TaxID=2053526 RepID=A0A955LLQ1_UNCKA|nr:Asp-tRNA(Asn)/Glu-tRNA(Gln) amidotransferase subunit GatB [candidate division WWE3 bacterium]
MSNKNYETIIGLEIHIQLKTKTGLFSSVSNDSWQAKPNSLTNPVELGLPGALPAPNKTAIEWTQRLGRSLNCRLNTKSKFDRKNYFYPDLPRGYQLSQYDEPFCEDGFLDIKDPSNHTQTKRIHITRIHLEEDSGKSMHKDGKTYLDFNKAGTPLVELVTEPDFRSPDEASVFSKMIQEAVRILDISDADMEKGQMRLEANVSVRKLGETELPNYRVELKNINSFKFMRDAINYEVERQIKALESGEELFQETRGWMEKEQKTVLQRSKEEAHDYRYFPEPDIPPFDFDDDYFARVLKDLPVMPWKKEEDLLNRGVREDYAHLIAYDSAKYATFENLLEKSELAFEELVKVVVNTKDQDSAEAEIERINSKQSSTVGDDALKQAVEKSINDNPNAVDDFKNGKETAIKFLIGQVMRETKGQADAQQAEEMLVNKLS